MDVLQINTHANTGGAARAAYRLHHGLKRQGHLSLAVVGSRVDVDQTYTPWPK